MSNLTKASWLIVISLMITGLITVRFTNCEGKCPSVKHAVEKWEAVTDGK